MHRVTLGPKSGGLFYPFCLHTATVYQLPAFGTKDINFFFSLSNFFPIQYTPLEKR